MFVGEEGIGGYQRSAHGFAEPSLERGVAAVRQIGPHLQRHAQPRVVAAHRAQLMPRLERVMCEP